MLLATGSFLAKKLKNLQAQSTKILISKPNLSPSAMTTNSTAARLQSLPLEGHVGCSRGAISTGGVGTGGCSGGSAAAGGGSWLPGAGCCGGEGTGGVRMGKHSLESPPQPVTIVGLTVIGGSITVPQATLCYVCHVLHVLNHSCT